MISYNSAAFGYSTTMGLCIVGVIGNHTWTFQEFSTYGIGCSMTFTEFQGKKRHRNNSGPRSFAARTPDDID